MKIAHFIYWSFLVVLCVFLAGFSGLIGTVTNPPLSDINQSASASGEIKPIGYGEVYGVIEPRILMNLVNDYRRENKLSLMLKEGESTELCQFAQIRVKEIKNDWSHNGFLKHTKDCDTVMCGKYLQMGENLARGFMTEKEVIDAWIASPKHLEQLRGDYDSMCVVVDGDYVVLNLLKK